MKSSNSAFERGSAGLNGKIVAVPEGRELDRFARMLEAEGATALKLPLVRIVDARDADAIYAWIGRLIEGGFDDLILLTGEGLTRLLGFAERAGRRDAFIRALGAVRTITRGPKPAAALHRLGLHPSIAARKPTVRGVRDVFESDDLRGRRIAVQLYGQQSKPELIAFFESRGADVAVVAPYEYVPSIDDAQGIDLLEKLSRGAIDAVAFTSGIQVEALFGWAERKGLVDELAAALRRTTIASVGPACSEALARRGVAVEIAPQRSFFLRSLVGALSSGLGESVPGGDHDLDEGAPGGEHDLGEGAPGR